INYLLQMSKMKEIGAGKFQSLSGTGTSRCLQAASFELGSFEIVNPTFNDSKNNSLGLYSLSRFNVTFDFPNGRMYLRKSRSFEKSDGKAFVGLHVVRKDNKTVAKAIRPQSPAEKAGIRPEDIILEINDIKTSNIRLYQLESILSQAESDLRLT